MQEPLYHRKDIPFFYDKSEKEIQEDVYERYDPMVLRQSALHLADDLWGQYPMQSILELTKPLLSEQPAHIAELGCSVGRWIGSIATQCPTANCWGIDYSYQLLKQAHACWVKADGSHLNYSRYGFSSMHPLQGRQLPNLSFGLAKAEALPFDDASQDLVLSSFLLDRLTDIKAGLQEIYRITKKGGKIVIVTPLNFAHAKHWEKYYPPIKIYQLLMALGFEVLDWQEDFIIEEPLDLRGNKVVWNCIATVLQK